MIFLIVVRVLLIALLVLFLCTQVIFPLFSDRKMFSMFSKKRNSIRKNIIETKEELGIKDEEEKLKNLQKQLNQRSKKQN